LIDTPKLIALVSRKVAEKEKEETRYKISIDIPKINKVMEFTFYCFSTHQWFDTIIDVG